MTSTISEIVALIQNGTLSDREKWRVARRFAEANSVWALVLLMRGKSEHTVRLRREYWVRFGIIILCITLMFALIFIAAGMIGDMETEEFTTYERVVIFGFIGFEVIDIVVMFLLAFSCHRRIVRNVLMEAEATVHEPSRNMPEWEEVVSQCRDAGLDFTRPVANVVYHGNGDQRAVILDRGDGSYEVVFEKLIPYDEEDYRYSELELPGYWSSVGSWKTIVDSIDRGREIAMEEMAK